MDRGVRFDGKMFPVKKKPRPHEIIGTIESKANRSTHESPEVKSASNRYQMNKTMHYEN